LGRRSGDRRLRDAARRAGGAAVHWWHAENRLRSAALSGVPAHPAAGGTAAPIRRQQSGMICGEGAIMLRRLFAVVVGLLAIVGIGAIATGGWLLAGGIGTRKPPGALETIVARRARAMAIPSSAREMRAPAAATRERVKAGMEHFADHCAVCHANDGSGDVEMGRGLYPRPPDMRKADTQSLSDGELFYVIENGVKLT